MLSSPQDGEPVGHVIGTGTWRDLLRRVPRPVLAVAPRELYRVMVEGTGFSLPIEGSDPAIGFYTTFFVAASSIRTAERAALERTRLEWRRRGMLNAAGGVNPTVGVSEIERVPQRFRWRSGGGFSFYDKLEE